LHVFGLSLTTLKLMTKATAFLRFRVTILYPFPWTAGSNETQTTFFTERFEEFSWNWNSKHTVYTHFKMFLWEPFELLNQNMVFTVNCCSYYLLNTAWSTRVAASFYKAGTEVKRNSPSPTDDECVVFKEPMSRRQKIA